MKSEKNKRKFITIFINLFLISVFVSSLISCSVSLPKHSSEIAMYKINPQRTGAFEEETGKIEGKVLWSFKVKTSLIPGGGNTLPIYWKGTIFFGCSEYLFGVDANSGSEKWQFRLDGTISTDPTIMDDVIFFGSGGGGYTFSALDLKSKKLKWSIYTDEAILTSPLIVNDMVYFGSKAGTMYAVSAKTGKIIWNINLGDPILSSPAYLDGIIYFGTDSGAFYEREWDATFYAIDANTGKEIWKFKTEGDSIPTPCIWDNKVYFGTYSDDLNPIHQNKVRGFFALDAKTGEVQWKHSSSSGTSSPIVSGGVIYRSIGCIIIAQDANNGNVLWTFHQDEESSKFDVFDESPAFAGDRIYMPDLVGHLYSIDVKTGKQVWKIFLGRGSYNPRAIDNPFTGGAPIIINNTLYMTLFLRFVGDEYATLLVAIK